jgi:hypothetical protein
VHKDIFFPQVKKGFFKKVLFNNGPLKGVNGSGMREILNKRDLLRAGREFSFARGAKGTFLPFASW